MKCTIGVFYRWVHVLCPVSRPRGTSDWTNDTLTVEIPSEKSPKVLPPHVLFRENLIIGLWLSVRAGLTMAT